ncbi:MAG: glycoside hydrolase family 66 protein [Eubacteriales bacterium]|nr:glycoside hydrolase family 66 protein [Eubacteriales bacterium]
MTELIPRKGRYETGEAIAFALHCPLAANTMEVVITHLAQEVYRHIFPVVGQTATIALPPLDAGGYGVEATLVQDGRMVATAASAINVAGKMVRYGFLSDFLPHGDADMDCLAAYHIDHVQFYDWAYRHDTPVPPTDEYTDLMGKRNSLPVIRQKIAGCHARGMKAMAYAAVYAAGQEFWQTHQHWGLYAGAGKPMVFIGTFYYMDLESPWRDHFMAQCRRTLERVGFDGLHMDTYGEPKRALTEAGEPRELGAAFPALIRDTAAALRLAGYMPHLIFNNVGAWPVAATCREPQDAVYMELWPPMDRYHHLRQAVAQAAAGGQPVVVAAYPAPFRTDTPQRALTSELLLSFAIALCGATQLFLGEEDAVITQGYYADYTRLQPWQQEKIKAYQDFFVRYQDLFFDETLEDVSLTHACGDNREYRCDMPFSLEGDPDRLWLTFRENDKCKLIGLINLCGVQENYWNTGKETPTPLTDIPLHALALRPVTGVWFATPDAEDGAATPLAFACAATELGTEVSFTVPALAISGLVWLETT